MDFRLPVLIRRLLCAVALLAAGSAMAGDLFGPRKPSGPLSADQAFQLMPVMRDGDRLRIEWDIAPGYFLYRSRIVLTAVAPAGSHLGALQLPAGEPHHDAVLGDVEIYRNDLTATADNAAGVTRVRLRYQGCADIGICYPPQEQELDVSASGTP